MIPHSRPWITAAEHTAVAAQLASGQLAHGAATLAFEGELAAHLGLPGVATASGTDALTLALSVVGVGRGDEVVVPTWVCGSVEAAVRRLGATPVFADLGSPFCVTAESLAVCVGPRTRAVVPVATFGLPVAIAPMRALGVPVVEDACQAFGPTPTAPPHLPHARVFSFHTTKALAAGEGGFAAFADPRHTLAARLGRDTARIVAPLADLNAALGRAQLGRFDAMLERRRAIAARYFDAFPAETTHALRAAPDPGRLLRFALRFSPRGGADFDRLQTACATGGVAVRRGVDTLLHRAQGLPDAHFPNASAAYAGTLSVPFHPSLTDAEVDTVIAVVTRALGAAP